MQRPLKLNTFTSHTRVNNPGQNWPFLYHGRIIRVNRTSKNIYIVYLASYKVYRREQDATSVRRTSFRYAFFLCVLCPSLMKLERHNQINSDCLPKFFQTDNESSSTKTAILCLEEIYSRARSLSDETEAINFHLFITSSSVLILYS